MISLFALQHLPKGTYTFGDTTKGSAGTRVSGYQITGAGIVTEAPYGHVFVQNVYIGGQHFTPFDGVFIVSFDVMKQVGKPFPIAANTFSLRTVPGHTLYFTTDILHSKSAELYPGFHRISFRIDTNSMIIEVMLNGEHVESVAIPSYFKSFAMYHLSIMSSVYNLSVDNEDTNYTVNYEPVHLEVVESVGWEFLNVGENPLSSGFDNLDPTLNVVTASLDTPARAVLRGHLTHPSKQIDIRLTSRATLNDKPIKVTFNGVTKDIIPTGAFKYGELVFQVEDVPAGDFEIILTKEV